MLSIGVSASEVNHDVFGHGTWHGDDSVQPASCVAIIVYIVPSGYMNDAMEARAIARKYPRMHMRAYIKCNPLFQ